jgi:hypothetical protein
MGGFFFAAGMAAWTLAFDRKGVSWPGWLLGSAVGSLGLLPWLGYLLSVGGRRHFGPDSRAFLFWPYLATDPLGLGLNHSLDDETFEFLAWPAVASRPTFLVGLLYLVIGAVGVWLVVRAAVPLRSALPRLAGALLSRTPTALAQNATLWPYGLLLLTAGLPVHRHYLVIAHPFEILAVCRLALAGPGGPPRPPRAGRCLLAVLCVAELLLSVSFLWYIHTTGAHAGDYGTPYRAQPFEGK